MIGSDVEQTDEHVECERGDSILDENFSYKRTQIKSQIIIMS